MKPAFGCKLLGAHQALTGIRDGVVLFHSVVGCNFGSMAFHFAACHMTDVRQTCTVISDREVVFGGENSLEKALKGVRELYEPSVVFVVTGCVSDIIQDDVKRIAAAFEREHALRVIPMEAAGYRGSFQDGFEQALRILAGEMELPEKLRLSERGKISGREPVRIPVLNILGIGADDPRAEADLEALEGLLNGKARIGTVFSHTDMEGVRCASGADLNLVFGCGAELAGEMERRFGIPYEQLDYPYGLTGAEKLWDCLEHRFGLQFTEEKKAFETATAEGVKGAYSYLQALYGLPVSILGTGARAAGLAEFLSGELGMEIEVCARRESVKDLEDFYDQVRRTETAFLFGSSFEQELADELEIPLLRFDFPVFDRVCLTRRPYIGAEGTLCLIEDLLQEALAARSLKGAMYQ
ncbi:MAG: nitrogenase component 1 [Candidatus Limivivens sp.]|nr:nitrogenase component 1 [Candidatus Limivivens sp.]